MRLKIQREQHGCDESPGQVDATGSDPHAGGDGHVAVAGKDPQDGGDGQVGAAGYDDVWR
jgi:hypothetical protein